MFCASPFLAAFTFTALTITATLRRAMRAFSMHRASRPKETSAEKSGARLFAGDDRVVSGETVAFSPLPHNPAFHPRRLFRHGRHAGGISTEAIIVRPRMRRPCLASCE